MASGLVIGVARCLRDNPVVFGGPRLAWMLHIGGHRSCLLSEVASRYQSGAYIVYPGALEEDTTVWFAFDLDRELWEGVLAIREAENRARLVGVPLWTYGVNLDDVVELIESGEGAAVAVRVVDRSSNRTFRVVYPDLKAGDDDDRWRQLLISMESWDCWFDVLSPGYLAISVPEATAKVVERYLNQRANAGDFIYERGDAD